MNIQRSSEQKELSQNDILLFYQILNTPCPQLDSIDQNKLKAMAGFYTLHLAIAIQDRHTNIALYLLQREPEKMLTEIDDDIQDEFKVDRAQYIITLLEQFKENPISHSYYSIIEQMIEKLNTIVSNPPNITLKSLQEILEEDPDDENNDKPTLSKS